MAQRGPAAAIVSSPTSTATVRLPSVSHAKSWHTPKGTSSKPAKPIGTTSSVPDAKILPSSSSLKVGMICLGTMPRSSPPQMATAQS